MDPNNPDNPVVINPGAPPSRVDFLPPMKKSQNMLLWVLSGVVGLMFIIVLALVIIGVNLVISSAKNLGTKPVTQPVVEQPTPTVTYKSRFATDSGVLKIKDDIVKLRSDIDSTDLFEPQISAPNIDLNIRIQSTN